MGVRGAMAWSVDVANGKARSDERLRESWVGVWDWPVSKIEMQIFFSFLVWVFLREKIIKVGDGGKWDGHIVKRWTKPLTLQHELVPLSYNYFCLRVLSNSNYRWSWSVSDNWIIFWYKKLNQFFLKKI